MIFTVLAVMAALFALAVSVVALSYARAGVGYISLFVLTFAALICGLAIAFWNPKMLIKCFFIPIVFVLGVIGLVYYSAQVIDEQVAPALYEHGPDIGSYMPFVIGSRLARLDERSSFGPLQGGSLPRLDCATALYPVLAAFVEAVYPPGDYAPGDRDGVFFQTDTEEAYNRLISGEVDIILAPAPTPEQIFLAEAAGLELSLVPIGKEALVFFVNADNPVSGLAASEIMGIYTADITNWMELGGDDAPIIPYQRRADSASQSAFESLTRGAALAAPPTEEVQMDDGQRVTRVADYRNYQNAIGYSLRYYTTGMVMDGWIKLLAIGGAEPTDEAIRTGYYPLTARFYAVTAGEASGNLRDFIDWMTSSEGQRLVSESGYVALGQWEQESPAE